MNTKSNWPTPGGGFMNLLMGMSGFPTGSTLTGAPITTVVGSGTRSSAGCGYPMIRGAGRPTGTAAGIGGHRSDGIGFRPEFGGPPGCIGITDMTPTGIEYVFMNGKPVLTANNISAAFNEGKVL